MRFVLLLLILGCTAPRVEREVLVPAVCAAWPAVRQDALEAVFPPTEAIEDMDAAVELCDQYALRQVLWVAIEVAAAEGIENQLEAGEVGAAVAQLLRNQLREMDAAMEMIQGTEEMYR